MATVSRLYSAENFRLCPVTLFLAHDEPEPGVRKTDAEPVLEQVAKSITAYFEREKSKIVTVTVTQAELTGGEQWFCKSQTE